MIHIERMEEPDILIQKKEEWTHKFIASGKPRPDSSKYGHKDIRNALFTMSHNKCYYCENILKGKPKEIDHFIEVAENKELAFEWSNLYLSCSNCNKKMANRSISTNEALDPCIDTDDEIEKHIFFEAEQITYLTEKGEKTIRKYRLSAERLDFLRLKELQRFTEKLITIQFLINQEGGREMSEDEKESLKRFARADNNFSFMFSKLLKKYNII